MTSLSLTVSSNCFPSSPLGASGFFSAGLGEGLERALDLSRSAPFSAAAEAGRSTPANKSAAASFQTVVRFIELKKLEVAESMVARHRQADDWLASADQVGKTVALYPGRVRCPQLWGGGVGERFQKGG